MKPAIWAEIHRLHEIEQLSNRQIAQKLGCSRYLVKQALLQKSPPASPTSPLRRRSIDPFKDRIARILEKHPNLSAVRIHEKIAKPEGDKPGYQGGLTQLRAYIKSVRPRNVRVYQDAHYEPGEAIQVDWGDVGPIQIGNAKRRVSVFVGVLCYSRMVYLEFSLSQRRNEFYRSIVHALEFYGGSPKKIIFDNLKAAVISGSGRNAVLHPEFAALCGTYYMEPIACQARDPESKGLVENTVRYVKRNALAGRDDELQSWDDYKYLAIDWRDNIANNRVHNRLGQRPVERFESEKSSLRPLPPEGYNSDEIVLTEVRSTAQIEFDCNRYSVPPKLVRRTVTVRANAESIRILHEGTKIAEHERCYSKRESIVNTQHRIEALQMRHRRSMTELEKNFGALGEEAQAFQLALSKLPVRPTVHLRRIVSLIELYGREAVLRAMRVAIEYQTIDAAYVEAIVLQERRKASLPSPLPLQPKRKDLIQLELDIPDPGRYDNLTEKEDNDDQSQA